ncbi:MAG TPA: APC family permease [Ktedonobacterales bacterium]|nr:APC family permease [Ktedonobacterales bacterium]
MMESNDSDSPNGAQKQDQEAAAPRNVSRTSPLAANRSERRRDDQPLRIPGELSGAGVEQRTLVRGSKLGSQYVRIRSPMVRYFRAHGPDTLEATELTLRPRTPAGQVAERVKRLLIGQRLPTTAAIHERLTKVKALAVLSSDAISSVAYATEASLGVLIAAGVGTLGVNPAIALAIVALMLIVGMSYFQTIHAYPRGGGSYIVARDNLGDLPGLIAAAALMIDYVLTVSVSVSAGIDALVSAVTPLAPYDVPLGVGCIVLILVINLRGVREAGTIFTAPTYLFIISFLIMIGTGIFYAATHGGLLSAVHPSVTAAQRGWGDLHQRLGILLILTAFASGCSAMTGTEAISDGIPAFKPPESRNAGRTLLWMVAILATLFVGITYLAWRFGIVPFANQQPTLDSQIASLIFLKGYPAASFFYYVIQFATLLILVLAANTSFSDFPRLSWFLARDGFLPHLFSLRGDRLAFTTGIVVLGALSGVLLVVFKGSTDALINLYALGVFTAFTLSQSGMVVRWWRLRAQAGSGWRRSLVINAAGATTTGIVAAIVAFTKFERGAWVVVILVPLVVLMFRAIARHYRNVEAEVSSLDLREPAHAQAMIVLVPVARLDRVALRTLSFAREITPNTLVVHVATDPDDEAAFRTRWEEWTASQREEQASNAKPNGRREARAGGVTSPPAVRTPSGSVLEEGIPRLVVIESPYRSLVAPLISYVRAVREANPGAMVTVILPEFVPAHWWERILHNQTALRLKLALYSQRGVVVANLPYHLAR